VEHPPVTVDLVTDDLGMAELIRELAMGAGLGLNRHGRLAVSLAADRNLLLVDSRSWDQVTLPRSDSNNRVMLGTEPGGASWAKAAECGVTEVIAWPEGKELLSRRFREFAASATRLGTVVAVTGGRGGCGATTLAAALAVAAVSLGRSTVLLDADSYGGGLARALDLEHGEGRTWANFAHVNEPLLAEDVRSQLAQCAGMSVLSGPWGSTAGRRDVRHFVQQACEQAFDIVIMDLPRYEVGSAGLPPGAVLFPVTTLEAGSLVATAALLAADVGVECLGVVVRDVGPVPVSAARKLLNSRLEYRLKRVRSVTGAADRGQLQSAVARGPVADLAARLMALVADRVDLPDQIVTGVAGAGGTHA
jgi:secretion/DNA translocation related CpaE-like protein